jgi:hypothetical protein
MSLQRVYCLSLSIINQNSNKNNKSNCKASCTLAKPEEVSMKTIFLPLNVICQTNGLLLLMVGMLIGKRVNVVEVLHVHAYH